MAPVGTDHPGVVCLGLGDEGGVVVHAAVEQRARPAVDDGHDVLPRDGLVRLQGVRQGQDHGPVVLEQVASPT